MTDNVKFDEVKLKILDEIYDESVKTLNTLSILWKETFEDDLCTANVEKLAEHVKIFYNEIIDETKSRQDKIKLEINQLYAEALHLKKVLSVDVNLPLEQNIPLYSVHKHLTECLHILREQLEHRQGKIEILLEEQKALCNDLDEYPEELKNGSVLPTDDDLIAFRQYLDNLIKKKHNRLNEINKLRVDIEIFLMKLDISLSSDDVALLNNPRLQLTKKNISKLNVIRTDLQNRYNNMREEIIQMKEKLDNLWDIFELDDNIKQQFGNIEYNQENYNLITRELEFWEQERRSNVKQFVIKIREEINYWFAKNLYSESEKANFSILTSNCYTEELLKAHELELQTLKDFYCEHEKIFKLIEERELLWNRMRALEGRSREPGRYTNRGGQLLKEEKERKTISKKLPAIENEILILTDQKSTNKNFTVYGIPVAELIKQDWIKLNEYKQEIKFSRKKVIELTPSKFPESTPSKAPRSAPYNPTKSTPSKPCKVKRPISTVKQIMKSVSTIPSNENSRFHVPKMLLKEIPARKNQCAISSNKLTYQTTIKSRKSNERRISTGRITKTRIQINNSAGTDSVNYDSFKDYITPRSPCRSSMMSTKEKPAQATTSKRMPLTPIPGTPTSAIKIQINNSTIAPAQASISKRMPLTPIPGTPTKKFVINNSPMENRVCTPRPSSSVRKFSTANLPILI